MGVGNVSPVSFFRTLLCPLIKLEAWLFCWGGHHLNSSLLACNGGLWDGRQSLILPDTSLAFGSSLLIVLSFSTLKSGITISANYPFLY